ncbi:MAG: hypothetical protein WB780_18860, partial [Candidatus Acidiferrales bacterium]
GRRGGLEEYPSTYTIDLTLNNAMTSSKKGKLGLQDAASQFRWRISDTIDRPDDVFHQLVDVLGTPIGELPFGERPNSFVGIKFRGIRGEMLDSETRVSNEEFLEWFPLMSGGVI